jgi:anti-sigma-K factor RskA
MTCDDADLLLAAHAVGSLDHGDESDLRVHLRRCADCRVSARVYLHLGGMIAETVTPVTPPPSLRATLMARVAAESTPRRAPWHRRVWARVPAARPLTIAGGLAAAAASVLAAWSFASAHDSGAVALHLPTCGSAGTPASRCTLDYDTIRHQAVLSVDGLTLPAVLGGASAQTYEVWLIPTAGAPLPTAFLAQGPGGGTWSAVIAGDLGRYAAVAVTAEPPGGSPAPTGPEVLRVPLPVGI